MAGFPEFALDRTLRSCVLTRELLQQIESHIVAAERDLMGDASTDGHRIDISVFDAFGMESFHSAADIPTTGFPETTETVRLVFESVDEGQKLGQRSIKLKLAFRRRHGIHLSIRLRGPQSRERAIGMFERIRQLTDSQSIDAWLFRRRDWVHALLGLMILFVGIVWLAETHSLITANAADVDRADYLIRSAVLATSVAYLGIVHYLFPRCAFETGRWAAIRQWRMWAAQSFAGLIVFDVLVFSIGKQMAAYLGLAID